MCLFQTHLLTIPPAPFLFHFFAKNDIILPCPALLDPFFDLSELEGSDEVGFGFVFTGSSSENDSHAGSSRVTAKQGISIPLSKY
jgi:hypothetical protein